MKMWDPFFIKEGNNAFPFLLQSLSQPVITGFYFAIFCYFVFFICSFFCGTLRHGNTQGASADPHRCLGPCILSLGKLDLLVGEETNSDWSKSVFCSLHSALQPYIEVKGASWCSHLKGREGYRVTGNREKNMSVRRSKYYPCTSISVWELG